MICGAPGPYMGRALMTSLRWKRSKQRLNQHSGDLLVQADSRFLLPHLDVFFKNQSPEVKCRFDAAGLREPPPDASFIMKVELDLAGHL